MSDLQEEQATLIAELDRLKERREISVLIREKASEFNSPFLKEFHLYLLSLSLEIMNRQD